MSKLCVEQGLHSAVGLWDDADFDREGFAGDIGRVDGACKPVKDQGTGKNEASCAGPGGFASEFAKFGTRIFRVPFPDIVGSFRTKCGQFAFQIAGSMVAVVDASEADEFVKVGNRFALDGGPGMGGCEGFEGTFPGGVQFFERK